LQQQDWTGVVVTLANTIAIGMGAAADVPSDAIALGKALIAQREYTLVLYADMPAAWWDAREFPYVPTVNPPLWELAHIAWFQEFFALRWRADDVAGGQTPSCLDVADQLFDSRRVAHRTRWALAYPSRAQCLDYMQQSLDNTVAALTRSDVENRDGFRLALVHEDMHAEALGMTLATLGLALPEAAPKRRVVAAQPSPLREIDFAGGEVRVGARTTAFAFDNEKPAYALQIQPFAIDACVVTAAEFAAFVSSTAYRDSRFWSAEGNAWRAKHQNARAPAPGEFAAMHVNYFEAEAYCRWQNRRLPTEFEWEHAATSSEAFSASTGHVWEWTSSAFAPYPGFQPERYREYSEPWFDSHGVTHRVLKGGSFVTHPRLKYPQYRNFYTPDRNDMFCGFRTCAVA
jgi:gamma-glutamyl hercynylcysteine S-oxide synthase